MVSGEKKNGALVKNPNTGYFRIKGELMGLLSRPSVVCALVSQSVGKHLLIS